MLGTSLFAPQVYNNLATFTSEIGDLDADANGHAV